MEQTDYAIKLGKIEQVKTRLKNNFICVYFGDELISKHNLTYKYCYEDLYKETINYITNKNLLQFVENF